jgi:segregation and condensation protein A
VIAPKRRAANQEDLGPSRASYLASTLAAGLELVREGELEARQAEHFADLYLRARGLHLEAAE